MLFWDSYTHSIKMTEVATNGAKLAEKVANSPAGQNQNQTTGERFILLFIYKYQCRAILFKFNKRR